MIPMEINGRTVLPGFRLKRLEMLNWGTFNGVVQRVTPDNRWTMLVGVNGTGKSTAADALRTLLVPPARATYNDASIDHKLKHSRKDRTRKTYIRGAYGAVSQEDTAAAKPMFLREEGILSIILAVFTNEVTRTEATLAQIHWVTNDESDQIYLVAKSDKSIKDHLTALGSQREMSRNLRKRGFEVCGSFPGYEENFRRLIGIPGAGALEVFNQAIGVKEVTDLNTFIRKHMLESANMIDFINAQIRPHYAQLNACWAAIQKAEAQLELLKPLAANHAKMVAAQEARERLEEFRRQLPGYYQQRQLDLRITYHEDLEQQITAETLTRDGLATIQAQDEEKKQSLLSAIDNDEIGRRLKDIAREIKDATRERDLKRAVLQRLQKQLTTLQHPTNVESQERFDALRQKLTHDRDPLTSNLGQAEQKLIEQGVNKRRAEDDRARISKEAESVRNNKVLIPEDLVRIRSLIHDKTGIPEANLPFAGELMEVKPDFKEWTGAIERVLRNLGTSLLVPEQHYFEVSKYINHHHLGTVLNFFRIPATKPTIRQEILNDTKRIPFRLVFDEAKPLTAWVKAEVTRRFDHICCNDVQMLSNVEFGVTKEGMIKNGARHMKDDRSQVNNRSKYVLGWNTQAKLAALAEEFEVANKSVNSLGEKLKTTVTQIAGFKAKLAAIEEALLVESYAQINYQPEQEILTRLTEEKEALDRTSSAINQMQQELEATEQRLANRGKELQELTEKIGGLKTELSRNQTEANKLKEALANRAAELPALDMPALQAELDKIQDAPTVTLDNILEVKEQVDRRLQGRSSHQLGIVNDMRDKVITAMANFLSTYPEEKSELQAEIGFGKEFCALRERIEQEQLPTHKQRFFSLLNTNLIMDIAALNTKLAEAESDIRKRIDAVNQSLHRIKFSKRETHVQIVVSPTRANEIHEFRAALKRCLSHGIMPTPEAQTEIYAKIRELIAQFENQPEWTNRVTDVRNWLDYGVKEIYTATNKEAEYYSASSGKSGGQKSLLAFTILASAITAQYRLTGEKDDLHRFRLVVVDEAFGKTDEENSQRALELFKELGLQLLIINPFDAKSRIVENYVDSYHLVSVRDNVSSLRRATRDEYIAARDIN